MTAKIKLNAASGGGSVSLEAPSSTTSNANVEFKLPVADGTSGQALTTNASGQLAFASVAVGGASNIAFNAGYGLDFSATADSSGSGQAELFDDYEEGSWTPTVSSSNASFSSMTGKYVKVGRMVTLWFYISGGGSYSGSGALEIGGLPFTNNTGVGVTGTSEYYKVLFAESYSDHCTPYVTGSNIRWLRNNSASGSGNYLTVGQHYTSAPIKTFICYATDT